MSKILKPRRGSKSVMSTTKASTVLAAGEIFFESNGTIGASKNCGLKMGDGSTAYADLPYFIDGDIANVEISSIADKTAVTTITSCLSDVATGKTLGTVLGAMKQALALTAKQFDDLYPIGIIIHSTTLDTSTKVKAIYHGTTWISHSGYVLRGATSGVVANSATKTGGNDNMIVPYHNHSASSNSTGGHSHMRTVGGWASGQARADFTGASENYRFPTDQTRGDHSHTITVNYAGTNGNTTNANIPNYKSVYIWERTA